MRIHSFSTAAQLSPQHIRLIFAIGLLLVTFGLSLCLLRLQSLLEVGTDFTYDYVTARALREGRSIYDQFTRVDLSAAALDMPHALAKPDSPVFNNIHPPSTALLFLPISLLPYNAAILVWTVLSIALYVAIIWLVSHELGFSLGRHWAAMLLGLALCWYPFQAHIALGQISLPLIALIVGGWALLRRGHDRAAGTLLGVACLLKLFPGLLVLYLLLRRRWIAAAAAFGVLALGAALTLTLVGWDDTRRYFVQVVGQAARQEGLLPINMSLNGVFNRLLVEGPFVRPVAVAPLAASFLVGISSLGVLVLLAYQAVRQPLAGQADDATFALTCLAMLLISPITWQHVLPVLVLPFGLLFSDILKYREHWRIALALLALACVSLPDVNIARGLMQLYAPYQMPWYASLLLLGPTLGLLLLWWLVATRDAAEAVASE